VLKCQTAVARKEFYSEFFKLIIKKSDTVIKSAQKLMNHCVPVHVMQNSRKKKKKDTQKKKSNETLRKEISETK
jgi:hypothetical protein